MWGMLHLCHQYQDIPELQCRITETVAYYQWHTGKGPGRNGILNRHLLWDLCGSHEAFRDSLLICICPINNKSNFNYYEFFKVFTSLWISLHICLFLSTKEVTSDTTQQTLLLCWTHLELTGGIYDQEFGHIYCIIFMETWIQAALILYTAIIITAYQMFIWVVLLVSNYRALGHDFTELAYMNIFKLIYIPW
jgi:hypothetical protein